MPPTTEINTGNNEDQERRRSALEILRNSRFGKKAKEQVFLTLAPLLFGSINLISVLSGDFSGADLPEEPTAQVQHVSQAPGGNLYTLE